MTDGMNGDFPRWGDFPEKLNLTYIRGLIKRGMYFDDRKMNVLAHSSNEDTRNFCPESVRKYDKFRYLIYNE